MGKGKINKKHPRSQAKGKTKHEDRRPKDGESTKQENTVADKKQVDDAVDVKEVNEVTNENQVEDIESKKYARRKIESNWGRYEEAEVDEHFVVEDDYDETKDFEYIRQNSASASSLFKFKEEKEWGKDAHVNNEDTSVLGLDLAELAASLQHYGLEEKLGLVALIQEEYKYCIKGVLENTSKPRESSSFPPEPIKGSGRVTWSYDGIENYKYLIGLIPENKQVQIYPKPDQNDSIGSVYSEVDSEQTVNNAIKKFNKNVSENSMDSKGDCDILDELLINKISFNDSNEWLNDCRDNQLIKQLHNKTNPTTNKENEELPLYQSDDILIKASDGVVFKNKVSEEELDLDMLLECDALVISQCESKDGNNIDEEVDADLDQWLDDMLI